MKYEYMYEKPIDRPIDAVVKASSVEHLANELDEYVITPELAGHLNRFFDEYNDPDATGNGAWIAGFFGSGKSHMLKILAVLLEDQEVAGKRAVDYILPKLEDDPALRGAMEVARTRHPSESILFNIDTIAPNQGRTEAGALLAAFIKVFNRHCGYFDGDQQHIAKMEYDLDRAGLLGVFVAKVEDATGKAWVDVRKAALLYAAKITAAFDEVCGNEPGTTDNVVSYYQQTYKPDIHSFAVRVKEYIDDHKPGFRLNFFVDEVGQFIAKDSNLMTNLQSVAEELATVCDGASWVVVTSQENMEDTIGQMTDKSANDFSKIQARFKIKMQLTSKDAKEVIKQRLLAKSRDAVSALDGMYDKYRDDFPVLFDFADGSKRYVGYKDEDDFVGTYPFVPYQFDLFITAMRGLSDYNAFTGKHHSTGARSMLGVFQEVGVELNRGDGSTEGQDLATFDSMFEGLRNSLKSEVYGAISIAETNLADMPMAIRVLKALLLVKYCKDFKATPGNLRVLLYGSFKQNTATLEQEIKDALAELERQLYIRRNPNSNIYEYLTDDEKEIETEIRTTEIQTSDVRDKIGDAFKDIVGASRASYENGSFSHSFPYNLKVNGDAIGRSGNDLTVDIVTDAPSGGIVDVQTSGPKTLTVVLHNPNAFLNDVALFVKTNKYVNQASGSNEIRNAIIADKRAVLNAQSRKLRADLDELIGEARFYVSGVNITDSVSGSGKVAIECAVGELVRRSYTGLQQIVQNYTDRDVYKSCLPAQSMIDLPLPEYAQTVLSWIGIVGPGYAVTVGGDGTSSLMAHFTKDEYGWPDVAVRNAVATLYAAGRVEIRKAGSLLEGTALAEALKVGRDMDKLVVAKVEAVSPERLASIKSSFRKLVGTNPVGGDAKSIAGEMVTYLEQEVPAFRAAEGRASTYPFATEFTGKLNKLNAALGAVNADWKWLVDQFPEKADALAEDKVDLSSMKQFIEGSPLAVKWNEVKGLGETGLAEMRDLGINITSDLEGALAVVNDPQCYKSRDIPRAASDVRRAKSEIDRARESLRSDVAKELDEYRASFVSAYDMDAVPEEARLSLAEIFDQAAARLAEEQSSLRIRTFLESFKDAKAASIVSLLNPPAAASAHTQENDESDGEAAGSQSEPARTQAPMTCALSSLRAVAYGKPTIKSRQDVDDYLEALRAELEAKVDDGIIVTR